MGCCFSSPSEDGERDHLLGPNIKIPTESARAPRPAAHVKVKSGRFVARHVGVNDLDERFQDAAETFNKQQENYEGMRDSLESLTLLCRGTEEHSLSQCLRRIREKHALHHISLEVRGYDFSLKVQPDSEIPQDLQRAQESIAEMSKAAKAVISVATKLQEMLEWLVKAEESMTLRVESAESRHQERRRLLDNLKMNLGEAHRARELSPKYRKQAGNVLNEAAALSGSSF
ncbi:hypothetical protein DNTS_021703 [Danionella cerebrum]|uniref:Uncharacterized protein n=1 Tax=Danionella cerebrum TaxID=2873325 RepID=A0A553P5C3_9TELE|nr:hypothetical protein DNTS_021703 [Danionella translucida]